MPKTEPRIDALPDSSFTLLAKSGEVIDLNISEEKTMAFGYKFGDTVLTPNGRKAIVVGVGCDTERTPPKETLWFIREDDSGISFWSELENLIQNESIKLIPNTPRDDLNIPVNIKLKINEVLKCLETKNDPKYRLSKSSYFFDTQNSDLFFNQYQQASYHKRNPEIKKVLTETAEQYLSNTL